jgi:hypothetical protein
LILATNSSNLIPHLGRLSDEWMSMSNYLGCLGDCIYVLGVPWGVLHLALH